MRIKKERKAALVETFSPSQGSGTYEAQIALLTEKITSLTQHLKNHPKDHATKRGLLRRVGQRERLLRKLAEVDVQRYLELVAALGLRVKYGSASRTPVNHPGMSKAELAGQYRREVQWSEARRLPEELLPEVDPDTWDALGGPVDHPVRLLVEVRERKEQDLRLERMPDIVVERASGRYFSVQVPVKVATALTRDKRVKSIVLRGATRLKDTPSLEKHTEDTHDSVGGNGTALTDCVEDRTPLLELQDQIRQQSRDRRVSILVIDDGFYLKDPMYAGRLEHACEVSDGRLDEVAIDHPHRLGRGDHGDRVVQIITEIAPEAKLFVAQQAVVERLDGALFEILVQANDWAHASPMIVNLSFGTNLGPHNGNARLERMIADHTFRSSHSRYVVKSAGNEGASKVHTSRGTASTAWQPGSTDGPDRVLTLDPQGVTIELEVKENGTREETISLWHRLGPLMEYVVLSPNGESTNPYCVTDPNARNTGKKVSCGAEEVTLVWQRVDGEAELVIKLKAPTGKIRPGIWKICIRPATSSIRKSRHLVNLRAWLARTQQRGAWFVDASPQGTVTIPGTHPRVLTVTGHDRHGHPLPYASQGPVYPDLAQQEGEMEKPEVALPAFSKRDGVAMQGTSFAAPRLTACLALALALLPDAPSIAEVRTLLREATRSTRWAPALGYGVLDYQAFANSVRRRC